VDAMHDVLPYNYRSFIIAEAVREPRSHHGVYEEKEAGALRELPTAKSRPTAQVEGFFFIIIPYPSPRT
jgi:hypothetical protein